jgi:uncharacterized protein YggT (Ycf19 family)
MGLIDFILNVAALLLWFNWRSLKFDPLVKTSAASLAGTLRRAEPTPRRGWPLLLALGTLLLVRAWVYAGIGPAVNWTPKLDLYFIVIPFRMDVNHSGGIFSILLYSVLGFGRFLMLAYFWMFFLNVVNLNVVDTDPLLRMLRLHLGRAARWHWSVQLLTPILLLSTLWLVLHPVLLRNGIVVVARTKVILFSQGLLVGASLVPSLEYLLAALLIFYLVTSYVYLGSSPFWDFVTLTTRNLLKPLRWLPLQFGRYDFAPLFWLLVLTALVWFPTPQIVHWYLLKKHITLILWPQ